MLIKTGRDSFIHPLASEITPASVYHARRDMLKAIATGAAGAALATWASRHAFAQTVRPGKLAPLAGVRSSVAGAVTMEQLTPYKDATSYNNFYEFGTDKGDPVQNAHTLKTSPWSVEIEGMVKKPARYALEDLLKLSAQEERIYRLRCVEGWSMVIPWVGYSLSKLIEKWSRSAPRNLSNSCRWPIPRPCPFVGSRVLDWPYVEGLRMDEAMNPLTLLAFGMYGKVLPNQNGAPLRVVVPWKYGFKSGKSLVQIRFTDQRTEDGLEQGGPQRIRLLFQRESRTSIILAGSQATERRIGEGGLFAKRRKTLMFNGYEAEVGQLYAGMDLKKDF